jgi:Mn2+/Fe2+ NRAMP family transporter
VKGMLKIALGIVTSIGGFVEVGSISTAAQAGAQFRFRLLWAVAAAVLGLMVLIEMSGRLAAVSRHTLTDAVRERFGWSFEVVPLGAEVVLDVLVLSAELGGVAIAVHLLTGLPARWFIVPAALAVWVVLWAGRFSTIENGLGVLGLVTLSFVVAALKLGLPAREAAAGFVPSLPGDHRASYAFLAVSILGATISPYLLNFYASGAVQEKWKKSDLLANRITAAVGMGFGGVVAMAVLATAALALQPAGIRVDRYEQAALMLPPAFGAWGVPLFAAGLAIGCLGAAAEIALNLAFALAQAFGWNWNKDQRPAEDARFSVAYTLAVLVAVLPVLAGLDPLRLTLFSMALTVMVLPVVVFPFLVLMNDERYVGAHRNGLLGNAAVLAIVVGGFVLALVAIPLEILGSGS